MNMTYIMKDKIILKILNKVQKNIYILNFFFFVIKIIYIIYTLMYRNLISNLTNLCKKHVMCFVILNNRK